MTATEHVLCVRATDLFRACTDINETSLCTSMRLDWLDIIPTWFVPRDHAEHDPSFKQIIPYVIVIRSGQLIGTYVRSKNGGESRLHGTKSIGFGGHVEVCDIALGPSKRIDAFATTLNAAKRELYEELSIEPNIETFGCIYNPTNEVGRVHVGVLACAYINSTDRIKHDASIASLMWNSIEDLAMEELEPWSHAIANTMLRDARVL